MRKPNDAKKIIIKDIEIEDLEEIRVRDRFKPGKMSKCMEAALEAVEKMKDESQH